MKKLTPTKWLVVRTGPGKVNWIRCTPRFEKTMAHQSRSLMKGIDPPNPAIANWESPVTRDEFEKLAQSVRDLASTHEQHREYVRFIVDLNNKSIDKIRDLIEQLDNRQTLQQQSINSLINALNELLELSQNFQQRIKQLETAP